MEEVARESLRGEKLRVKQEQGMPRAPRRAPVSEAHWAALWALGWHGKLGGTSPEAGGPNVPQC